MYCSKCGNITREGDTYCQNCGNTELIPQPYQNNMVSSAPIQNQAPLPNNSISWNNQNIDFQAQNINNIPNSNVGNAGSNLSHQKKYIIIILLIIIVLLLGTICIILFKEKGQEQDGPPRPNDGSRTIMMYIVGSNLESDSAIVTADLNAITPSKIDLEKTNVLIYTGGTKKWHNFVKNDENAIYILKEDGFEKLESYDSQNMGDYEVLKEFLDYGYENYQADRYNLIMYNHGGAIDGAMYDDFTNDNLSLAEMSKALSESKFNEKNKLDTILFRTCLNGTIEVANVFAPYAEYMIASEEITFGSGFTNVLSFLNDIKSEDDGIEFGKKFISSYKKQMNELDPHESIVSTYSIVDLSLIDDLKRDLKAFISDIDVEEDYRKIARVRSNLYQYALESSNISSYDTVDLYTLVDNLKSESSNADKLLKTIDKMVKYNWSNNKESHGLSVYFPFNGEEGAKVTFLDVYKKLEFSSEYNDFIKSFAQLQSNPSVFAVDYKISANETTMSKKEFSLTLTDDQAKNYANASYIIFEKMEDNTYMPIYTNTNASLNGNTLTTNINDTIVKVIDKKDNSEAYLQVVKNNNDSTKNVYETIAVIHNSDVAFGTDEWKFDSAKIYLSYDENNKLFISQVIPTGKEIAYGTIYSINDYTIAEFTNYRYKILDESGKYNENWIGTDTKHLFSINLKDNEYEFVTTNLDSGEFYCLFQVTDITNNKYYSNLIKID